MSNSTLAAGMRDLIKSRQSEPLPPENEEVQSPSHPVTQSAGAALARLPQFNTKPKAKSADPDYTRITVYIRRDTNDKLRRRLLDEGGREMSDLVQQLLDAYL